MVNSNSKDSSKYYPRKFDFDPARCVTSSKNESLNFSRYEPVYCFTTNPCHEFHEFCMLKDYTDVVTMLIPENLGMEEFRRNIVKACINSKLLHDSKQVLFFDDDITSFIDIQTIRTFVYRKPRIFSHDGCEHKIEVKNNISSSTSLSMYLTTLQYEKCASCRLRDGTFIIMNCPILLKFTCLICNECFHALQKHYSGPIEFIEINGLI